MLYNTVSPIFLPSTWYPCILTSSPLPSTLRPITINLILLFASNLACFWFHTYVEMCRICLSVPGLFHLAQNLLIPSTSLMVWLLSFEVMNSVPLGINPIFFISSSATDTSGFHSKPLLPCAAANTECRYFLANWFQIFWVSTQKKNWWVRSGFCFLFLEDVLCGGRDDVNAHLQRQGRLGHVQSRGEGDRWMIKDKERGSEVERKGLASRGLKVRKETPTHTHTQIPMCLRVGVAQLGRNSVASHVSFHSNHRPLWGLEKHSKWGTWFSVEYSGNVANPIR